MKATSILTAFLVLGVSLDSAHGDDAVGNVYPSVPVLTESERPLSDVGTNGWLWWKTYSLGAGEHFESDPSTSSQAESDDARFIYKPKLPLIFPNMPAIDNPKFLEANIYYHLSRAREFALSMGAHEVDEERVRYDVWQPKEEGRSATEDNAFFSSGDNSIHFDASNPNHKVHTATDASVAIHEYGHYVEHQLNEHFASTGTDAEIKEARGLGEGFADAFANACLGTPLHSEVFHSVFKHEGGVRSALNTKKYADIVGVESHLGGAVFSGMCWDMRLKLGTDVAAKLFIAGVRAAKAPVTYRNAVQGILVADNQLYQGAHIADLKVIFANRGLDPDAPADASGGKVVLGGVLKKLVGGLIGGR